MSDDDWREMVSDEAMPFAFQSDPEWPYQYDCCQHCHHDINDPPHAIPCPEGCPS